MEYRRLGKTGIKVSEISLGTWQVGGGWREKFEDATADSILDAAVDAGVNFLDTADVYGDGQSERAVGRAVRRHGNQRLYVASKCGRKIRPHVNEGYTPQVLRRYVEDSLKRLNIERLDLIQLHCPPPEVYLRSEIFFLFDDLRNEGKIANLGVSVETVDEALAAMDYYNVTTLQIIFNMFRHKPIERLFITAAMRDVGIIVRVPLASGLLTGTLTPQSSFAADDHRNFNREGKHFDKGETFSGVPYEEGLKAVDELRVALADAMPEYRTDGDKGYSMAAAALRWILMSPEVSTIIPGASKPAQVTANVRAASAPPFNAAALAAVTRVYNERIRRHVHDSW